MRSKGLGLIVIGVLIMVFVSFGVSGAQVPTQLIVATAVDYTLWKMTCNGLSCSSWSKISGYFADQPTVAWDPALGRYVLFGVGLDHGIWRSTFDIMGNHNNDWVKLPGYASVPVAAAGGSGVSAHGSIQSDGTIVTGSGFTVNRTSAGMYYINFTVPFTTPPHCVVSVSAWPASPVHTVCYQNDQTTSWIHVACLEAGSCSIEANNGTFVVPCGGIVTDQPFTFICID
jgi:hypothetical protein